jgi:hypothetical protein
MLLKKTIISGLLKESYLSGKTFLPPFFKQITGFITHPHSMDIVVLPFPRPLFKSSNYVWRIHHQLNVGSHPL